MKKILPLFLLGIFSLRPAHSQEFAGVCPNLTACVEHVSKLTGKSYLLPTNFKGKTNASANLRLTKENAGLILSEILNEAGYTRLSLSNGTYRVIPARDVRYNVTPEVFADKETAPVLPDLSDYYMMT